MTNPQQQKDVGGISANTIMVPILVVLSIIHVVIIAMIMMINSASSNLSEIMRSSGEYINDATSLLAGSSLMSETSGHFVLMPVSQTGMVNYHPLLGYANELNVPRRGHQVMERFRTYQVSETAVSHMEVAADAAEKMMKTQIHAISLIRSVYPLPSIKPLNNIPVVELTEAEKAMAPTQRIAAAEFMILNPEYTALKQEVSRNVNTAAKIIKESSEKAAAEAGKRIFILRTVLWVATLLVILILALTFLTFYKELVTPLKHFVRLITADKSVDEKEGMQEVRMVATAYNTLLKRRNALDDILRSAAETDALTNLPNRYRFERYILDCGESGESLAILMFDVNLLKQTNDALGHRAGDDLLRRSAKCISSCFGKDCFRIGGDEFAAVIRNCTREQLQSMIRDFREMEKQESVSISIGYAYEDAESISDSMVRRMIDEADKKMYEDKKELHSQLQIQ